jgi:hypothetical protein
VRIANVGVAMRVSWGGLHRLSVDSSGRKERSFPMPHGALRSSGCVGGLLGRSVRPQTGRVDPARHSFVWPEVRQNGLFRHADGVEWTRSQGRVERLARPAERAIESVNVTIKNLQNHNLACRLRHLLMG